MADPAKINKPWRDDENDAIVADYFAMLADELARRPYVKKAHADVLMERIGRTHKSVEFKHQNISAALDELGLPWIPGYIPKRKYQKSIVGAIDRYLSAHPEALEYVPAQPEVAAQFVDPPAAHDALLSKPMQRLVAKFDPVARDHHNRALGAAGEEYVYRTERQRLIDNGRSDLARKVEWTAAEEGDGAGYDVRSFTPSGDDRLIEVKTTNGPARTPFFLTRNEMEVAAERPTDWRIYRVHCFANDPRIFTIAPPLDTALRLSPSTWRAAPR